VKNANFWYKFAPQGKSMGSIEKVEYWCTTTNLPLSNDTIIVLKITLLHSVSVITNFVISKRDKQKNKLEINMHHLRGNAIPAGPLSDFWSDFYKIRHGEGVPGQYLHAELHGCGFKNVRPRVMYMTCKEEQIRLTGAPSYGCVLVISNIVRHNYKLNHNALRHTCGAKNQFLDH